MGYGRKDPQTIRIEATTDAGLKQKVDGLESQLAQKANDSEVRKKVVKLEMEDMSDTVISAVTGGATVNVLSIPQDLSVTPEKTDFITIGKNKIDDAKTILEERVGTSTGSVVSDPLRKRTDYIRIDETQSYVFGIFRDTDFVQVNTEFDIAFYDNSKVFISGYTDFTELGKVLIIPAGAKFIRISIKSLTRLMQLEVGTSSTEYEEYYTELINPNKSISIPTGQRTILGEMARGFSRTPTVISKVNRTVTFTGRFTLYYRNVRNVVKLSTDPDIVLQMPTASHLPMSDYIFYDIKENKFIVTTGGDIPAKINENCVMVMNLIEDELGTMTVISDLNYVIDDMEVSKNIYFVPEDITGYYNCLQTGTDFNVDPSITSYTDFETSFNNLVSSHSDYVITTVMGKDSSGLYDVYKYELKPTQPYLYAANKKLPTIILVVGLHGEEKAAMFSTYYLIKDILENWHQDKLLEYLRFNVNLVVMPCVNPYGFQNNTRTNSNGVDINRNFEYNWEANSTGGTAPFSEVETQYIKSVVDDNSDAIYYVDYHDQMTSSGTNYPDTVVHVISTISINQDITMSAYYHISKMTREFNAKYDSGNGLEYFGRSGSNTSAISPTYAIQNSIPASLLEGFSKFPIETEYYSGNTFKGNAESLGNWLLSIVKLYKNKQQ